MRGGSMEVDLLKLYRRSLWVFHLNSGSCNGCDIEVLNIFAPRPDAERFGVKLVGSPRHADAIVFTGPVTMEALPRVVRAFNAVPNPKLVIAIGSCSCGGGIWYDSYSVLGGINEFYKYMKRRYRVEPPPTIYVPGCPPKPEAILYAVLLARGFVEQKQYRSVYVEELSTEMLSKLKKMLAGEEAVLEKAIGVEIVG